jgi:hypothetical protein
LRAGLLAFLCGCPLTQNNGSEFVKELIGGALAPKPHNHRMAICALLPYDAGDRANVKRAAFLCG